MSYVCKLWYRKCYEKGLQYKYVLSIPIQQVILEFLLNAEVGRDQYAVVDRCRWIARILGSVSTA